MSSRSQARAIVRGLLSRNEQLERELLSRNEQLERQLSETNFKELQEEIEKLKKYRTQQQDLIYKLSNDISSVHNSNIELIKELKKSEISNTDKRCTILEQEEEISELKEEIKSLKVIEQEEFNPKVKIPILHLIKKMKRRKPECNSNTEDYIFLTDTEDVVVVAVE